MSNAVEKKYELIDGKEVMMSPAHFRHAIIQGNLSRILSNYLLKKRCTVFTEFKVVFDDKSWYQPDLLVVCELSKVKQSYIKGAPDFVVEILSPATQKRDVGIKKDVYEKYGVKEYWIIDPKSESITAYLLQDGRYVVDNVYHNYTEEEWDDLSDEEKAEQNLTLKLSLYDDLEIDVKEVFEKIQLFAN